jgi:hypothetical protein
MRFFDWLFHRFWNIEPMPKFPPTIVLRIGAITSIYGSSPMSLVLKDDQKCALSIVPLDAAGNPAPVDANPVWAAKGANPEILALIPSEDGLSCQVVTVGPLGTAQVEVTADALIGEGVVPLVGLLDVEVVGGQAVSLSINAGAPEPR